MINFEVYSIEQNEDADDVVEIPIEGGVVSLDEIVDLVESYPSYNGFNVIFWKDEV